MDSGTKRQTPAVDGTDAVYFWKEDGPNGYMGQWYESKLTETAESGEVFKYENCEHYMMHRKATLFAPSDPITTQILSPSSPVPDPRTLKALGRKIPNFDDKIWERERFAIVVRGNYLKFTQHPELKTRLLETGNRELVEASPRDRIWGVGFGAKNAPERRADWGLNLLGKALMEVRERIKEEEREGDQE